MYDFFQFLVFRGFCLANCSKHQAIENFAIEIKELMKLSQKES